MARVKKDGSIVFATFFPDCANIHLTKDVGMIPYILHRDFDYDAYVICHKNDDYSYLSTEVPGLKLMFIRKSLCRALEKAARSFSAGGMLARAAGAACTLLEAFPFMLAHAHKIEVLQLYHYKDESVIVSFLYKLFNPRGIVYLKLDLHPDVVDACKKDPGKVKASRLYDLARFDMISTEFSESLDVLRNDHPAFGRYADRLYYVPNGIDETRLSRFRMSNEKKDNIVLHVGRIGMPQKASEVALEAFARVAREFPSWRLVLIGSMEESFASYYHEFLENNADIRERIQYLGFLESREQVYKYYGKAKVFFFPSRFESFGLVAVEAGFLGDVLVASNIPPVRDMTENGRYGYLCEVDDIDCFAERLKYIFSHESDMVRMSELIAGHVGAKFSWSMICEGLHERFLEKMRGKAE